MSPEIGSGDGFHTKIVPREVTKGQAGAGVRGRTGRITSEDRFEDVGRER
jgi:hypothetical protein